MTMASPFSVILRRCHYPVLSLSRAYCARGLQHIVYVSKSQCIFENLALEDWLYEKSNLEHNSYLLMWRNKPCVVIGRHQNTWRECNVRKVLQKGVAVARRKSGGGAVFHDEGNLNLSFIKSRQRYNRKENLELVVQAASSQWGIDLSLTEKDNILLDGMYKVSGTAAKLGGHRTYHHFTLLWNSDLVTLQSLLDSPMSGINTKSTESIPASVGNLVTVAPTMDFHSLVECVAEKFLQQSNPENVTIDYIEEITESRFPGVRSKIEELQDWDWVYGKTPVFNVNKNFTTKVHNEQIDLKINICIIKGKVDEVKLALLNQYGTKLDSDLYSELVNAFVGHRLDFLELPSVLNNVCNDQRLLDNEFKYQCAMWIFGCLLKSLCVFK